MSGQTPNTAILTNDDSNRTKKRPASSPPDGSAPKEPKPTITKASANLGTTQLTRRTSARAPEVVDLTTTSISSAGNEEDTKMEGQTKASGKARARASTMAKSSRDKSPAPGPTITDITEDETVAPYAVQFRDNKNFDSLLVKPFLNGTEGTVNVVKSCADGKLYVRKSIRKSDQARKEIAYQMMLGSTGRFPQVFSRTVRGADDPQSMVMAYCNGGTLVDINRKTFNGTALPEVAVWHILAEVLKALALMRTGQFGTERVQGWTVPLSHRDLHCGNIFLHWVDDDVAPKVMIGDLGWARELQQPQEDLDALGNIVSALRGRPVQWHAAGYSEQLSDWMDRLLGRIGSGIQCPTMEEILSDFIPLANQTIEKLGNNDFSQIPRPEPLEARPMFWKEMKMPIRDDPPHPRYRKDEEEASRSYEELALLNLKENSDYARWVLVAAESPHRILDHSLPGAELPRDLRPPNIDGHRLYESS